MFGINTNYLPTVRSYDEAKIHYDSIKPIRGSDNLRPLGKRSKQHMMLTEGSNEHGHYYAAKLYSTECVRWYRDGRIQVRADGYSTQSTAGFIHAVSPMTGHIQDNALRVNGIRMADTYNGLWFEYRDQHWVCTNEPKCYIEKFNRTETARLRKLPVVSQIQTYLKSMKALGAYDTPNPATFGFSFKADDLLLDMLKCNGEPPMDILARFGEGVRGLWSTEMLYRVCMKAGLTTREALYYREYVPAASSKKGVICERR